MITIDLGEVEQFDPETNSFNYISGGVVRFEYSLKVLYEWEGKWKKPFLKRDTQLTPEETLDFYHMMALDPVDKSLLTKPVTEILREYILDPSTATTFNTPKGGGGRRGNSRNMTSEEIYAIMINAGVPLEFENRNLNRLLTLLRIISNQRQQPKKMSRDDIYRQNAELNARRKAKMNTKG